MIRRFFSCPTATNTKTYLLENPMALRETLTRLNRPANEREGVSQAELKEEWIDSLSELLSRIENYLSDYIDDGSIVIRKTNRPIKEDALGLYRAPKLIITAGTAQVEVTPVGRIVAGAIGRVDMHRQGRSRGVQTIFLLRTDRVGSDGLHLWQIHVPPPSMSSSVGAMVSLRPTEIYDLEKASFEHALDTLLS